MTVIESYLEEMFSQVFSMLAFHAIAVVFTIALLLVLVWTGMRNLKSILWRTLLVMGVLGFLFFAVLVANVALENAEDRGVKRIVVEVTGVMKFVMRFFEQTLFKSSMLDEL